MTRKKRKPYKSFCAASTSSFCWAASSSRFGFQPRTKTWISGFSGFRHWKNSLVSRNCQNASAWMKPHLLGFGFKSGSYIVELKGMKNLVDSLTESLAPRPWKQYGPAAALSALFPAGGMAKGGSVKTSNGSALFPAGGMAKGGSVKTSNGSALFSCGWHGERRVCKNVQWMWNNKMYIRANSTSVTCATEWWFGKESL